MGNHAVGDIGLRSSLSQSHEPFSDGRVQLPAWLSARPQLAVAVAASVLALLTLAAGITPTVFHEVLYAIVGVAALVGLRLPVVALLAAVVFSPTFGWATIGPTVSPFQILIVAAALGTAPSVLRRWRSLGPMFVRVPAIVSVGLFLAWSLVSAAVVRAPGGELFVRNFVGALVFMGVAAFVARREVERRWLVGAAIVGFAATALVGLFQLFTIDALVTAEIEPWILRGQGDPIRLPAPWGLAVGPWAFGKDALVGLLLATGFWTARRGSRIVAILAGAALFAALFASGNRSAWLGAIAALAFVAFARRRDLAVTVPAVALLAVAALLVIRPSTPIDVQASVGFEMLYRNVDERGRANGRSDGSGASGGSDASDGSRDPGPRVGERSGESTQASNMLRVRLTRAALKMIRDRPVWGVGPGSFREFVDEYEPVSDYEDLGDPREELPAHNVILEIWAGAGTPAVIFYLAFLGFTVRRLWLVGRYDDESAQLAVAMNAGMVGLFVASLFHNYHFDNELWLMAGLAASYALWGSSVSRDQPSVPV